MKKTILVIDDDPAVLNALRRRFKKASYICLTAESSLEGLAKASAVEPDLIILDLMLPRLNGFAFLRAMKKSDHIASIPVIVLTGMIDEVSAQDSVCLGATKYFTKDRDPGELVSLVEQTIKEFPRKKHRVSHLYLCSSKTASG